MAPVGSVMPLVVLLSGVNVDKCLHFCTALDLLPMVTVSVLREGGRAQCHQTTALAASEFVLLSRAGKRFSMRPPKGRQNHYTVFTAACFLDGVGYKDQDISWTISSV